MARLKLCYELVAHCLIGEQIISLARKKSRDRNLIILICLDAELAPVMAVGNERLVQLLNSEGEREILRVTVPDVADQAMKNSV